MSRVSIAALALGAIILGPLATGSLPVAAAQEATPAAGAECAATTPEENKALVTQFYEEVDGGNVGDLVTDDFVYHHPSEGEIAEPGGSQGWAEDRQEDFPDATVTVERTVAEGDLVAAYLTWSGTHQDDDEEMGVPATGESAEWVAAVFFQIECGKISDVWSVADNLGRLQDLGVITDEELQSAEIAATPAP